MRGLTVLSGALVLVATLTGCATQVVKGSAYADSSQVDSYQAARFDAAIKSLDSLLPQDNSLRGTVFKHTSFGASKRDAEWSDYVLGSPPAVFIKSATSRAGDNLDTYHPAGSSVDYLLLGDLYKALEPTPWVSVPTAYGADGVDVCTLPGSQTVCELEQTITETKRAGGVPIVKEYTENTDTTVTMLTAVTLASTLKVSDLLDLPSATVAMFTPAMLTSLIPLRINLDKDGNILQIQLDGTVNGQTPFVVQVGYQVTGTTLPSDFPPAPSVIDVTALDANAAQTFYREVTATS